MENQTLHELQEAARKHIGCWQELAVAADVSYSWLTKFVAGGIPNPGVVTVQKLRVGIDTLDRRAAAKAAA